VISEVKFKHIEELVRIIDHTLLRPDATRDDILKHCDDASAFGFFSVCINPWWVKTAKEKLAGSNVKVSCVVGFPLGMSFMKAREAECAIDHGADELDMVMAVGAFKSGLYGDVESDIRQVVDQGKPVKVILETCLLNEEEIRAACRLCFECGAAFVKTSTGFSKQGARADTVAIMRKATGNLLGVKASGGIRNLAILIDMVDAGATRIGTSSSVEIAKEFLKEKVSGCNARETMQGIRDETGK
jgi:deoxyribose-phosphate aldolase